MLGEASARKAIAVGAVVLVVATACAREEAAQTVQPESPRATPAPVVRPPAPPPPTLPPVEPSPYDFGAVSTLIDDAIAVNELPGAVVQIGHGGKVVFRKAYG